MAKQLFHILFFAAITLLLLSTIAKSQDQPGVSDMKDSEHISEEILEYAYKFDLPAEEKSMEITFEDLPSTVKTNFNKSYHGSWEVMKAFKVEQEEEGSAYMILVEKKGFIETVYYNNRGIPISQF